MTQPQAYIIRAELLDAEQVARTLALSDGQTLELLHGLLRSEFGWDEDHLYSFWVDGQFWGDPSVEYAAPIELEESGAATSRVRLRTLGLEKGQEIAYIFDYGDEWRVRLTVLDVVPAEGTYPRILERLGEAPPQYESG